MWIGFCCNKKKNTIKSEHHKRSRIWALQKKRGQDAETGHLHPEMLKSTRPRVNVSDQTVDLGSNFFTGSVCLTCMAEMIVSGGADELDCNGMLPAEGIEFGAIKG
jgi:hypothetical protein